MVYFKEYARIDEAFYHEKQVQGWSRKKKEALIYGLHEKLPELSKAYRDLLTEASGTVTSRTSVTDEENRGLRLPKTPHFTKQ